jgi:hypothetical protein
MRSNNMKFIILALCAILPLGVVGASAGNLNILLQASTSANTPGSPGTYGLPGWNPVNWVGTALLGTMIVVVCAAIVYALAYAIGSSAAVQWSRRQVYEALLSVAMLAAFLALAGIFFLNPQGAFSSLKLVPTSCNASSSPAPTTLYALAACDLATFNNNAYSDFDTIMNTAFFLSLSDETTVSIYPFTTDQSFYINTTFGLIPNFGTRSNILIFNFDFGIATLVDLLILAIMLNQVQLIIVSSSILFLFMFLALGFVARSFGFSRSFGGTLIAFGIGLGIIYPLLIGMTYGFINVQIQTAWNSLIGNTATGLGSLATGGLSTALTGNSVVNPYTLSSNAMGYFETALTSVLSGSASANGLTAIQSIPASFEQLVSSLVVGLTFIPLINIIIVDAFISDFSKAIGERVNLLSLLSGFI